MPDDFSDVTAALGAMHLAPVDGIAALPSGLSCDLYKVSAGGRIFVVKRACPKLRAEADWRAPPERSHAEVAWMRFVGGIDPAWVPQILGEDRQRHLFAMEYFPPETHPVWKDELVSGRSDLAFAAEVGAALARIHGETAGRDDFAHQFANAVSFHALRIDADLLHTAARHTDVAAPIRALAKALGAARTALMHGDFCPENILAGPEGPVFLDAEACCYGDPACDLAFCLHHLLLKAVWQRAFAARYADCFAALTEAYFSGVRWEARYGLERRTAALVSAFLLARIDGKAPVEYLSEAGKTFVRAEAKHFLIEAPVHVAEMQERWTEALASRQI